MFDSYSSSNRFSYNINAVSGTLRKSHPKSKIILRELNSNDDIFDVEQAKVQYICESEDIVILQIMLCSDNQALIEFVKKIDFEDSKDVY